MAGLQIGSTHLREHDRQRLYEIWKQVVSTTGQSISGSLPDDEHFFYHSEIACRAVKIIQLRQPEISWSYFQAIQYAFYVDTQNITSIQVLDRLAIDCDYSGESLERDIHHPDIITATREDFSLAKQMGAHVLPTLLMDVGDGMRLLAGGYTTAELLYEVIEARISK